MYRLYQSLAGAWTVQGVAEYMGNLRCTVCIFGSCVDSLGSSRTMAFLNINTGKSICTDCIFDSGEFLRQRAYFGIEGSTSPNVIHSRRTEHIDMDLAM